jgi:hypothetical protein
VKLRTLVPLCLAAAALVAAGCGSSNKKSSSAPATTSPATTSTTSTTPAKQVGAPGAKVAFVKPKAGSTTSSTVTVVVKVTGFKLAPKAVGKPAKQGEGHLHFSLDGGKFDQPKYSGANGQLAVKLGVNGKYSPSVTPTITYSGLPKGMHKLEVYLANNDHSNTGVEGKTSFVVK